VNSFDQIASTLKLLVLDVDGVLTDGCIIYDNSGVETKAFNIKDGLGIKLLQAANIEVAIITGRQSTMVERRAAELGITRLIQGREDKLSALNELLPELGLNSEQVAYMGDDLPDLAAIQLVGLGCCPADAVNEVREAANWIATTNGGRGAVRELAEQLLRSRNQWVPLIEKFYA
jgi:3-deoxy-D-manno-octulosonate 8-phosphate phosphatase (KDO 8-P phosphatase)